MVQARAQFVLDTQGCQVCQSLCLAPPGEWRLHNRDAGRGEARADLYFHRAKGSVSCDPGHPVTLTLVTRGQNRTHIVTSLHLIQSHPFDCYISFVKMMKPNALLTTTDTPFTHSQEGCNSSYFSYQASDEEVVLYILQLNLK